MARTQTVKALRALCGLAAAAFVALMCAAALTGVLGVTEGFANPVGVNGAVATNSTEDSKGSSDAQNVPMEAVQDSPISDLSVAGSTLDGRYVWVTGEVVGDSIRAEFDDKYRWITLQAIDGSYAQIAVYMTNEHASLIDTFGAYGKRGTTMQVCGLFNLTCPEHTGMTDLHVNSITVIEAGSVTESEFDVSDFVPGLVLVAIGAVLVFVFYRLRERLR